MKGQKKLSTKRVKGKNYMKGGGDQVWEGKKRTKNAPPPGVGGTGKGG